MGGGFGKASVELDEKHAFGDRLQSDTERWRQKVGSWEGLAMSIMGKQFLPKRSGPTHHSSNGRLTTF